jgi:hypothetical protein
VVRLTDSGLTELHFLFWQVTHYCQEFVYTRELIMSHITLTLAHVLRRLGTRGTRTGTQHRLNSQDSLFWEDPHAPSALAVGGWRKGDHKLRRRRRVAVLGAVAQTVWVVLEPLVGWRAAVAQRGVAWARKMGSSTTPWATPARTARRAMAR